MRITTVLGAAALAMALGACSDSDLGGLTPEPTPGNVATLTISGPSASRVGATETFTAIAKDASERPVYLGSFQWSISGPAAFALDSTGVYASITPTAAGTVTVSVQRDGVSSSQAVTVAP